MGQTLKGLAKKIIGDKAIFNNRFVVEVCECFHVHYRNLRIVLSKDDFISMASGMRDALARWEKQGKPETSEHTHIELCRKNISGSGNEVMVNLNNNLYKVNEGRIFAEGADFKDPAYIHLKIRDIRVELSVDDFNQLADAVIEAKRTLNPREVSVG